MLRVSCVHDSVVGVLKEVVATNRDVQLTRNVVLKGREEGDGGEGVGRRGEGGVSVGERERE